MNILITGSSGTVGKHLKALLLQNNHTVFQLVHDDNNSNVKKDLTWSIKNHYLPENLFDTIDCVIHLAGSSIAKPWTKAHKQSIYDTRILGTRLLVEGLKKNPGRVKHFISTSAIGFYPDPGAVFSEDSPSGDGFLQKVCKDWEFEAQQAATLGIDVSVVRVGLVLEPSAGIFPVAAKTHKLGVVPVTGSGDNVWSWIHYKDLIQIYRALAEGSVPAGTYNAVSPGVCTQGEFAKSLLKGKFLKFTPTVPAFLLKIILGDRSILPLTSQRVSCEKLLQNGFKFEFPEVQSAIDSLVK